ncbi:MAG: hypothetical protein ACI9FU_001481 [Granulosicoccus sp.]|jgi:hypothetical protein
MIRLFLFTLMIGFGLQGSAQKLKLGLLQYGGGGDWYANLATSLPNLAEYANSNLGTDFDTEQGIVEVGSKELFSYAFVHMTGHGNVIFSDNDARNLREYLLSGGFLHIDDNYGMDEYIRPELNKVFPELELVELPFDHPVYKQKYAFPTGLPKVHVHDDKSPKGLGLIHEGRLVVFYSVECDLGDGWESPDVHNDSQSTREKALKMGCNLLQYVLLGDDPDAYMN